MNMPQYDPDYDDSYLDEMEHDLKLEVDTIMHGKAVKQANEVYAGMANQGIKRFNPTPVIRPYIYSHVAMFVGGPEDGKVIAIPERTYDWVVAAPLNLLDSFVNCTDPDPDPYAPIRFKRGCYKLDGVVMVGANGYRAFIWQGWDGER